MRRQPAYRITSGGSPVRGRHRYGLTTLAVLCFTLVCAGGVRAATAEAPDALRVEYSAAPLGLDEPAPRLSWHSPVARQSAYRIRVGESADALTGDRALWDSGKVTSSASTQIAYAGPALESGKRYVWQVQTWDEAGKASGWSAPGWWEMGLLKPADWTASWIAGPKRTDHDWRDFTFTADLTLTGKSVDLLFRAQPIGKTYGEAYVWTLARTDKGPALVAQVRHYPGGTSSAVKVTELKRVALPAKALGDGRHIVSITAAGDRLTTAIDGVTVDTLTDASVAHGTIGFTAKEPGAAIIHRVRITGTTPFETRFVANDNAFTGGDVTKDGLAVPGGVPKVDIVLPIEAPAPLLRRAFTLPAKRIARARLYVAGAGWPRFSLNGQVIGASAMASGYTAYDKRVLYQTYDVTAALRPGSNAIGAELGRGWYGLTDPNEWYWQQAPWHGDPALRAQLQIDFADGTSQRIATDASWRTAFGPTLADSIYRGERYDARLHPNGWDKPGFADRRWASARIVDGPAGTLVAANVEPIAPVADLKPVTIKQVRPGIWVLDYGRIIAGWPALRVSGPRGQTVSMLSSERIGDDGLVIPAAGLIDAQLQTDRYTLAGGGEEQWEPRFGYRGFRYVQLDGFPGTPGPDALTARIAHSAVAATGEFRSSDTLLMQIDAAAIATIRNNMHGFQTDTPTLEKNGWTGDAQASAGAAARSLDVARVWTKWLGDFRDAQSARGEIPEIVPATPLYGYENSPGWNMIWGPTPPWDVATMILPWELYTSYGDSRILERMHDAQARLVDYTGGWFKAPEYRREGFELSEWSPPGAADFLNQRGGGIDAVASAYYFLEADLLAKSSAVIGKQADADRYGALARNIRDAYNRRYWDGAARHYRTTDAKGVAGAPTQIQNVLPLAMGMVPDGAEQAVADTIAADVEKNGLRTGVYATRYLLEILSDHGHADLAYKVATRTDEPSWGWWIKNGHGTMFESWSLESRSRDHHYFGSIADWMRQRLAGLRPGQPGYASVLVRPEIPAGLASASATMDTIRGRAAAGWTVEHGVLTLTAEIPANTSGEIWVPLRFGPVRSAAKDATLVRTTTGFAVYSVAAGRHVFEAGASQ
ncbi:family 78 glycoside hydrolase catalytic domain [Sphingomonas sp. So64.6b]|uniref:family 78 glycoside hydrolase catalytic domain n=1 Tax=Sphingomonas sp. So64.6b TaxID=2997354 RepID=UPI0016020A72|nr:family 78 glycoside hydrolase catalytic domain [Sphingomonas sp. So64.6b]QNA86136.1 family 78 glycoside hydrolase catalytic domain [Sphingomonas sp. So64.6b]